MALTRVDARDPQQGGGPGAVEPVGRLRGGAVEVDVRRVAGALGAVLGLVLLVLAAALAVAGAEKNAGISELRQHGMPARIVVTHCLGLMGGSGSNLAGYQCSGTLRLGSRSYVESIPGSSYVSPGTGVAAVVVAGDPPLVSTRAVLAGEQASWRVFLLPGLITCALVPLAGAFVLRSRRRRRPLGGVPPQRLEEPAGGV